MRDENNNGEAGSNGGRSHLRLIDRPAKQKEASRLSEPAANELRELLEDVQHHTPRKKQAADDDSLPPAA
ncbi:MAG: hypothetical protein ACR2G4_00750 [Pyrinomonadaceae bacterium]